MAADLLRMNVQNSDPARMSIVRTCSMVRKQVVTPMSVAHSLYKPLTGHLHYLYCIDFYCKFLRHSLVQYMCCWTSPSPNWGVPRPDCWGHASRTVRTPGQRFNSHMCPTHPTSFTHTHASLKSSKTLANHGSIGLFVGDAYKPTIVYHCLHQTM